MINEWNECVRSLQALRVEREAQARFGGEKVAYNAEALLALWKATEEALVRDCAQARQAMESELRWKLSNQALYASGFRAGASAGDDRTPLPAAWAGAFEFDAFRSIIAHGSERYFSVAISSRPYAAAQGQVPATPPPQPSSITQETISDLDDEVLLKVIEAYLDRMAISPDGKLKEPGKLSMVPFVARRMRHRAATGQLLPTLAAEAEWLEKWAKSVIVGHPTPKRKTISKQLGREYLLLKARSNAAIQNPDGAIQSPSR